MVITGGGLSGVCCALTAAREGTKVVLVQDRPVLGGNASSEVRLWILGATSHMGNNNRWAREGGVIDEILLENLYRNQEGNPLILDTILMEKVREEANIILLLNTAVFQVDKENDRKISQLWAYCSQNETEYQLKAPLFCDASGDGVVAFQAGASFRMGAESPEEFGEGFAPNVEDYGELLGHSIYFYSKDTGRPVDFIAPSFALKDAGELPRLRNYKLQDHGCRLWWVEFGGRMDTIRQSETIKWELWKVVYGIWDYVKNSGKFPEAKNLTLEWVGTIPGKRESRRFEGDYMLSQSDLVEQKYHEDAVAFGGWAMDLHPADGVYSSNNGCTQWHTKGVYTIPYRCFYSKDIDNLFLAGRIISASHVAFGSSRVMATCAHGGQAVGMAAAIATRNLLSPREVGHSHFIKELQLSLNKIGQSIPFFPITDSSNKTNLARIVSNDHWELTELPSNGPWMPLQYASAQILPLQKDQQYTFSLTVKAKEATRLEIDLRKSERIDNYTPEVILERLSIDLESGEQEIEVAFTTPFPGDHYGFLCLLQNPLVEVRGSLTRATGLVSVFNKENRAVSSFGKQEPPEGIGIDSFEFWMPIRRPEGHNLGFKVSPAITMFGPENVNNGLTRPFVKPNAFVADPSLEKAKIDLFWEENQQVSELVLFFDTDFDHALESSLMGHPESEIPFCVKNYEILNCSTTTIYQGRLNHQSVNKIQFPKAIETRHLQIILERPMEHVPAALYEILCY
ncbi:MAG: FAD-dependent oxidoreductase [Bacteroidota bacterium]